jgi:hypothetical protein
MIRRFSQFASGSGLYEPTQRHLTTPSQIRAIGFSLRRYPDLGVRWRELLFALMNCQSACSSTTSIGKASVYAPTLQTRSASESSAQHEATCQAKLGLP